MVKHFTLSSHPHSLTLRVYLVGVKTGRMENNKRKIRRKMTFSTVLLRGERREKSGGVHKFSFHPLQNTISPNWREKIRVKSRKNIWTKLPPPLINVSGFFFFGKVGLLFLFFSFDFSFVLLAFYFCFCFFCFFGFCQNFFFHLTLFMKYFSLLSYLQSM